MAVKYSNYVRTTVANVGGISASDTSLTVGSVAGWPSIATGDYMYLTLVRLSDNAKEIVKVTAVSGTTATIERGAEGTTAIAFAQGDRAENWITAGTLADLRAEAIAAAASALAAVEIGTANLANLGVTAAKIGDEAVTAAKIAAAVAGSGLSGGAGSALSVNVDGSTLEISGDNLRVKDEGLTNTKVAGGKFAALQGISSGATGDVFYKSGTSTIPFDKVYGQSSHGTLIIMLTWGNSHSTEQTNVWVRIGETLGYYLGTDADQGTLAIDNILMDKTFFNSVVVYQNATIIVPPGYRYMFEKNGSDGTPTLVTHRVVELK